MSFQPIPSNVSQQPMIQNTGLRDVAKAYNGSELDKPTFMEKLKFGFTKFFGMFGKLAGSVLSFLPIPGARIAAAGLYGLGNMSGNLHQNMVAKKAHAMQQDAYAAQYGPQLAAQMVTPGFDQGNAGFGGGHLQQERLHTLDQRGLAAQQALERL